MTHTQADRHFERWRRTGNAGDLAEVFDEIAPRLLRLAIHLVGDVAAAEDLVQATFVVAIESASSWDAARGLEPWLTGILDHRAKDLLKARRANADSVARSAIDEHTPLASAITGESTRAIVEAIDRLEDPYRSAMLLAVVHGMKPAAIAHVLDRSPGAVRVQLHRGREMLTKLLSASLIAGVLSGRAFGAAGSGLAQVKAQVLAHAAGVHAAAAALVVTGGVLMAKKVLVGFGLLLVVVGLLVGAIGLWPDDPSIAIEAIAAGDPEASTPSVSPRPATAPTTNGARVEAASPTPTTARLVPLTGRVLDGSTGTAIAGARVELFAPRRESLAEAREHALANGDTWPNVHPSSASWPIVLDRLSDLALAGREDIVAYDAPAAVQLPIAQAVTNERGEFEMICAESLGFLTCSAEGFETRRLAAKPYVLTTRYDEHGRGVDTKLPISALTIAMFAPKRLYGYLVDTEGNRVARRMHLAFDGWWSPLSTDGATKGNERLGTWQTVTQADGGFELLVGADRVYAHSTEPGLALTRIGIHPVRKERWGFESSWQPGRQTEPAKLIVQPAACLVVRERTTQRPVERFQLLGGARAGVRSWSGPQVTRSGRLALVESLDQLGDYMKDGLSARYEFTVWAEGFAATTVAVENLLAAGEILVELEQGSVPSVRGRVHDGARALAGTCVTLVPAPDGQFSKSERYREVVDAVSTDEHGDFELRAPVGSYALCVTHGTEVEWRAIRIPCAESIDFDLGIDTSIVARIRDSKGNPCVDHALGIRGPDGSGLGRSDEQGIVHFTRLAAGSYDLNVPYVNTHTSFRADEVLHVDVRRGERREVEITVPAPEPRFARLVLEGGGTFDGWTAQNRFAPSAKALPIETNGRIPIDIQRSVSELTLRAPDRRTWNAPIPKDPPDGYEIRIALDGPGYQGVLTSLVDGQPLANMIVTGRCSEDNRAIAPSCTTDSAGVFRLTGLAPGEWTLGFDAGGRSSRGEGGPFHLVLQPNLAPTDPHARIAISLPTWTGSELAGLATTRLSGRVLNAGGARFSLSGRAELSTSSGALFVSFGLRPDAEGAYTCVAPVATRYQIIVHDAATGATLKTIAWEESSVGHLIERNLEVP